MKFTVLKENLKKTLSIMQRIVLKSPGLPILENILIEAENKQLKISATNLELGVDVVVKGKTEKEGKVSVPAFLLSGIINNVKEERVVLEGKGMNLEVKTESFQGLIKGQDANEFPIIPRPDIGKFLSIDAKKFAGGLSQVSYAATVSEIYPEISGVFFSFTKDRLLLVATDSFRLGKKEINEQIPKEFSDTSFILPLRSSQELLYIIDQQEANQLRIGINENQVVFTIDDVYFVSRLLSGSYPDYSQLIPADFTTDIEVNKEEFMEKIKLTAIFSPKTNDCRVKISESGIILSSDTALGSAEASVKARVKGVSEGEIIFNYHYLLDGLFHIPAKEVVLHIKNKTTPVLFKGIGDESYVYLVAPLKG